MPISRASGEQPTGGLVGERRELVLLALHPGHVRQGQHKVVLVVHQVVDAHDHVGRDACKHAGPTPARREQSVASDGELGLDNLHRLVVGQLEGAEDGGPRDEDEGVALGQVEHRRDRGAERRDDVGRAPHVIRQADGAGVPAVVERRDFGRRKRGDHEPLRHALGAEDAVGERARGRPAVRRDRVEPPLAIHLVHAEHRGTARPGGPAIGREHPRVLRRELDEGDGMTAMLVVVRSLHAVLLGPNHHAAILPADRKQHVAACGTGRRRQLAG